MCVYIYYICTHTHIMKYRVIYSKSKTLHSSLFDIMNAYKITEY